MRSDKLNEDEFSVKYSRREDLLNSLTHGFGAALSVIGLGVLLLFSFRTGDMLSIIGCSVYGVSLVFCHVASTLYHSFRDPRLKRIFRLVDHSSIFLLIAGTYTPFLFISLQGAWRWSLFGIVWGIAFSGIGYKALFINRHPKLGGSLYVILGMISVFAMKKLAFAIGLEGVLWIIGGGASYLVGLVFCGLHGLPYNHTIWHLFSLGGAASHFVAVIAYAL